MSTKFWETEPPWFPMVKDLKPGAKKRLEDDRLGSFNGKGYTVWDFRERVLEVYQPRLSLAELLAARLAMLEAEQEVVRLAAPPFPKQDHPRDWPVEARVWMHKAHFDNNEIINTGAYWNGKINRVVLPYRTLDGNDSWIARDVGLCPRGSTKYLFPSRAPRGGGALVPGNGSTIAAPDRAPHESACLVTEDLLSSYRAAWATGYDSIAAQGITLDRSALLLIAKRYQHVAVWLDPDKYGRLGQAKLVRDLGAFGVEVTPIRSGVDPKLLSAPAIRELLLTQWNRA